MESSSVPTAEAATSGVAATLTPVPAALATLTMLNTPEDGDVCGVDGACL